MIKRRKMSVDYDPALAPMLDALDLSFIICEAKRRRAERRSDASGAVADIATAAF